MASDQAVYQSEGLWRGPFFLRAPQGVQVLGGTRKFLAVLRWPCSWHGATVLAQKAQRNDTVSLLAWKLASWRHKCQCLVLIDQRW